MKSCIEDLQKRGYADKAEIIKAKSLSQESLLTMLCSDNAVNRTIAAYNLSALNEAVVDKLLNQLCIEKCLYTKIAICENLKKGNVATAEKMLMYLGEIGNNQYKQLPNKVSAKKSYPLPRDIISRTIGKMNIEIFPLLIDSLNILDVLEVSELLDAVGYMAFYNPELVNNNNVKVICGVAEKYYENGLIVWKTLQCLSAFPVLLSVKFLQNFYDRDDILGKEAKRSLKIIQEGLKI